MSRRVIENTRSMCKFKRGIIKRHCDVEITAENDCEWICETNSRERLTDVVLTRINWWSLLVNWISLEGSPPEVIEHDQPDCRNRLCVIKLQNSTG